jgi:hypothetical protein
MDGWALAGSVVDWFVGHDLTCWLDLIVCIIIND